MKREDILNNIRIAASKGHEDVALRWYIEARNVSYQSFIKALNEGRNIKSRNEKTTNNDTKFKE